MRKIYESFFEREKIDVYGEISAGSLKIIQPHLMPENIKSAVIWLIPYYTGKHPGRNVSLYAVSKDYHLYAKDLNRRLCALMKSEFPEHEFYGFCDSSPVNEISAAITAGLGVLGKNRLLINEKYGSFVFIGCMLSTMAAENPASYPEVSCMGCGKCTDACDFLSGKGDVCKSELNQRKILSDEELACVKESKIRWGCDICQEVCPMNGDIPVTPIDFFHEDIIENITVEQISEMSKEEFSKRAYAWRGKKTILRNIGQRAAGPNL